MRPDPDPVIEAFKRDVDQTLLVENLRRTPAQRAQELEAMARLSAEMGRARRAAKRKAMTIEATDYAALITALDKAGVAFIVTDDVAAAAHGSPRFTQDVDVVYARTDDNLDRVVRALRPLEPYPRGAPPGLPFECPAKTLKRGLNFTLRTSAGSLDLLGEIVGGGRYEDLDALIRSKRAAGRVKDFEAIAELELLQELGNRSGPPPPPKRST